MIRDTIPGMDGVFHTDVQKGSVILITGGPGSLKSALTYSIMANYLSRTDEFGLYTTLEEGRASQIRNMRSLGIDLPENLEISDYSNIRSRFEDRDGEEVPKFIDMVKNVVRYFKEKEGERFTCFALDSLGALYSLMESHENLRAQMFYFFKFLRELNLTAFIVMETPLEGNVAAGTGCEGYLVDGIIQLGFIETKEDVTLYMQVTKMRACSHSRKKHMIEVSSHGLHVLGSVFE